MEKQIIGDEFMQGCLGPGYIVEQTLSRGASGVVYRASHEDCVLDVKFAIKEIDRYQTTILGWSIKQRIESETRILSKLNHPGIVKLVDSFEEGKYVYLVQEYVEGTTLEEHAGGRSQKESAVLNWMLDVCDAIGYMHTQSPSVVHRDLKPSNLMVQPSGAIKVIDFSTAAEAGTFANWDYEPLVVGTSGYAAPEYVSGSVRADPRMDIYSIGATMWHLLAGEEPPQVFPLPDIKSVNPFVGSGVAEVVSKCLTLDMRLRYQSCDELRQDIARLLETRPISSTAQAANMQAVHESQEDGSEIPPIGEQASRGVAKSYKPTIVGSVIDGKYRVLCQIGAGGHFVIWLAQDVYSNRLWAIKEFMKDEASRKYGRWIDSARVESALLMGLNHPALSNVVDMVENDDALYVVMSYVQGDNLLSVMERGLRAITEDDVVDWGIQLCDALQYLHDHNIVYRNMRPGNVILQENGSEHGGIRLLAEVGGGDVKRGDIHETMVLYRLDYISPEVFSGNVPATPSSDIYSLGVTLFHLVTGHAPGEFWGMFTPPSVRSINPAITPELDAVIAKATALKPEDRFQTCSEMKYYLEARSEPTSGASSFPHTLLDKVRHAGKAACGARG